MAHDLKGLLDSVVLTAKSMSKDEVMLRIKNSKNKHIFKDVLATGTIDLFWENLFNFKQDYEIVSEIFSEELNYSAQNYFNSLFEDCEDYFDYNLIECSRSTLSRTSLLNNNLFIAA